MSKILRSPQRIFGGSLSASGNIAQFGSLAAGSPAYSLDPAEIQQFAQYYLGWAAATIGNSSPALQDRNALDYLMTRQLAYLFQAGVSEWDGDTTYYQNSWCSYGAMLYISLSDNNTDNLPTTETDKWKSASLLFTPPGAAKAWVNFNGASGTILSSFNVSSVSRTAAGSYTINFATAMADANYAVIGTCGASNGGNRNSPIGNNNAVCRDTITNVNQFSIWLPKPDQTYGEDASLVSVSVFGN